LNLPLGHLESKKYVNFWIGMDVGFTNHPSEILVLGEYREKGAGHSTLKILTRIHMRRVRNGDQVKVMMALLAHYKPKAFSLDRTGVGLPLYQDLQDVVEENKELGWMLDHINGYVFNSKILVDFDKSIEVDKWTGDAVKDAGIHRTVIEYSTDKLRGLVDARRLVIPWDRSLLRDIQGQTETVIHLGMDSYGRRKYSGGDFHCLDALRMAVLGWSQHAIEALVAADKWKPPVYDSFVPAEAMDIGPTPGNWQPVFDSFG
jgi:hypothetical protein